MTAITGTLTRGTNNVSPFALLNDVDARVSHVNADTIAERDAIEEWRRKRKMTCYVIETDTTYRLGLDVTIAGQVWSVLQYGVPDDVLVHDDVLTDDGYIKPELIQNIFLNSSYVVDSESAMLALTTLTGNFIIRTDTGDVFVKLNNDDPAGLEDFAALTYPGAVLSVNGLTGNVVINLALLIDGHESLFNDYVSAADVIVDMGNAIIALQDALGALDLSLKADLVGGKVPLSQLPYNFINGLTRSTNDVGLGGNLASDTEIDGLGGYDLSFTDIANFDIATTGEFSVSYYDGITDYKIIANDTRGFRFGVDYTSGFGALSIIHKQYADQRVMGTALGDPNADRIMFWDDSAGTVAWLIPGAGISISGTTITSSGVFDPELTQDAIGSILTDTNSIDFTYNDSTPSITADVRYGDGLSIDATGIKWGGTSTHDVTVDAGSHAGGHLLSLYFDKFVLGDNNITNTGQRTFITGTGTTSAASWSLIGGEAHTIRSGVVNAGVIGWQNEVGDGVTDFSGGVSFTFGAGNVVYGNSGFMGGIGGKSLPRTGNGDWRGYFVYAFPEEGGAGGLKPSDVPYVTAAKGALNISRNTNAQTDGHGALARDSGILMTVNGHIPDDSPRTLVLGGINLVARANDPDQVYVPNFNILSVPDEDDALTQVLVRDPSTGAIKFRDAATLGGGGGGGSYTDEQARDAVAAMIQNTSGITWTYDDAGNTLTPLLGGLMTDNIAFDGDAGYQFTIENVGAFNVTTTDDGNTISLYSQDTIGITTEGIGNVSITTQNGAIDISAVGWGYALGVSGVGIILNLSANSTGDTYYRKSTGYLGRTTIGTTNQVLTVSGGIPVWATPSTTNITEGSNLYFTNERAQDAVGTIMTDSASIDFTYDDAGNSITGIVKDASITYAKIQNIGSKTLIGRGAASTGVSTALAVGGGFTMDATNFKLGGTLVEDLAFDGFFNIDIGSNTAIQQLTVTTVDGGDPSIGLTYLINSTSFSYTATNGDQSGFYSIAGLTDPVTPGAFIIGVSFGSTVITDAIPLLTMNVQDNGFNEVGSGVSIKYDISGTGFDKEVRTEARRSDIDSASSIFRIATYQDGNEFAALLEIDEFRDNAVQFFGVAAMVNKSSDPTGVNGDIYYNTTTDRFRAYQDGTWINLGGSGGGTFQGGLNESGGVVRWGGTDLDSSITIGDGASDYVIGFNITGGLIIGDDDTGINSGAILELVSNTKGFVLTRIADEGDLSPIDGMVYYNTTANSEDIRYYINGQWIGGTRNTSRQEGGTTYTLVESDRNCVIYFTSSSPVTVTLDNSLSLDFQCFLVNFGGGVVTLSPVGTLYSINNETDIITQNTGASVSFLGDDSWAAFGYLGAADTAPVEITKQIGFSYTEASAITTGGKIKTRFTLGYDCSIVAWYLDCDPSATLTLDVWANPAGVPTNSNSLITSGTKPGVTAGVQASDNSLDWATLTLTAGTTLELEVEANNNATWFNFQLIVIETV